MKTLRQLTITTALLASTISIAQASNLQLTVSDISVTEGFISVAVFDSEENYNKGKPIAATKLEATANSIAISFPELADGDYAIKLLHDENSNGKLDTNFVGMPTEGYGFSNNSGRFGPASYSDAKFVVAGDTAITINLH